MQKESSNNSMESSLNSEDFYFYRNCDYFTLHEYAVIMGVFICYYLRIVESASRNNFKDKMNAVLKEIDYRFENKDFLDIPNREELFILNNMEIEKGIAKNRALLDNTFSL